MSLHSRSSAYLTCDECEAEGPEARTGLEVRALAYLLGWRFPPRILKSGVKSTNRSRDICPECAS